MNGHYNDHEKSVNKTQRKQGCGECNLDLYSN